MLNTALRLTALALAGASLALLATAPWRAAALADLQDLLVGEPALGAALDARVEAVRRCQIDKEEVTVALVAGRLTLAEAADLFERLEARRAEVWVEGPPTSRRAEIYQQVLLWASTRVPGAPREKAAVLAR